MIPSKQLQDALFAYEAGMPLVAAALQFGVSPTDVARLSAWGKRILDGKAGIGIAMIQVQNQTRAKISRRRNQRVIDKIEELKDMVTEIREQGE